MNDTANKTNTVKTNIVNVQNVVKPYNGYPRSFKSPQELQQKIDSYFNSCWRNVVIVTDKKGNPLKYEKQQVDPYTVLGMVIHLNTTRETLSVYERGEYDNRENNEIYSDIVKHAKNKVEEYAEKKLYTQGNNVGLIFLMKNRFKWVDKHEIQSNINVNSNVEVNNLSDDAEYLEFLKYKNSKEMAIEGQKIDNIE